MIDLEKLEQIRVDLRRLIRNLDDSPEERLLADALVYLDCADYNLRHDTGKFRIAPQIVTDLNRISE